MAYQAHISRTVDPAEKADYFALWDHTYLLLYGACMTKKRSSIWYRHKSSGFKFLLPNWKLISETLLHNTFQAEIDHLFKSLVLPNFTYCLSMYGWSVRTRLEYHATIF